MLNYVRLSIRRSCSSVQEKVYGGDGRRGDDVSWCVSRWQRPLGHESSAVTLWIMAAFGTTLMVGLANGHGRGLEGLVSP